METITGSNARPALTWLHLFLDTPRAEWQRATRFWSGATGWALSEPRGEAGQFVTLQPADGSAWVKLQAIEADARIHLELDSDDPGAAVLRSESLGANRAWVYDDVQVMRSPGGLLFCHTLAGGSPSLVRSAASILDQVCLDIPPESWTDEVDFWRAMTGRHPEPGRRTEFASLAPEHPADGPRILLQRLDSPGGEVRGHPDFAVADRAAETARHVALGARVTNVLDGWTVLRAPGGQVYCLTDRDPHTG